MMRRPRGKAGQSPGPRAAWAASLVLGLAAWLAGTGAHAAAPGPCRVPGLAHEVLCGQVERPLDPARPEGVAIQVHYVVVRALARRKLPDPVFLLAGGPGQSAIDVAPSSLPLFARLNNRRDIVFVDQRGTGRSAPLVCDEMNRLPLADQASPVRQAELLHACRDRLATLPYVKSPDGLRDFTTTIAMADLDAVRQQLGAERIDLVGGSYGTRAALEYLRLYPTHVRRIVLDGVAPPDMALPASFSTDGQAALDAVFAACEAEPACRRRHPQLRPHWEALLKSLPRGVTMPNALTGVDERLTLTRSMVLQAVRAPLYVPSLAAALPQAIDDAAAGRWQALAGLASLLNARKGKDALALGMHFSVICAEDLPRLAASTDVPGRDFGEDSVALYRDVCKTWPRGEVPAAFYGVRASPVPVLLLSGGIDPATPPRHAERVAKALGPNAVQVVVPNAGHGLMNIGCVRDLIYRFIDAEEAAAALQVDASCVTSIPRPPAFLPLQLPPEGAR